MHVLPPVSSQWMRTMADVLDSRSRLRDLLPRILTVRTRNVPDDWVPWLIWEHGLAELLPYLSDPRRALAEGRRWQRSRGTPASLLTALGWIDFIGAGLEERPATTHWHEFLLALPGIASPTALARIAGLARISSPARSRLVRVYHGYDRRPLVVSGGPRGRVSRDFVSDWSGVTVTADGRDLVVSFGQVATATADLGPVTVAASATVIWPQTAAYRTRFLVSDNQVGDRLHQRTPTIEHASLSSVAVDAGIPDQLAPTRRRLVAACVVPSDVPPKLGTINAIVPGGYRRVIGGAFRVSDPGTRVSRQRVRVEIVPILARSAATVAGAGAYDGPGQPGRGAGAVITGRATLDQVAAARSGIHRIPRSADAGRATSWWPRCYPATTWHDHPGTADSAVLAA